MPLIAEFQFTKEIEDRLLAPMDIEWLAIEKVVGGMIQALVAGLVVIPAAWLMMGSALALSGSHVVGFPRDGGARWRSCRPRWRPGAGLQPSGSSRSG